jgi:hypothetical protein
VTETIGQRSLTLYLAAFGALIASLVVLGLGSIAGFSTSHFWISIVLSLVALIAAVGAIVLPHRG